MDLNARLEQAILHSVSNLLDTMVPMPFKRGTGLHTSETTNLMGFVDVHGKLTGSISIAMPVPLAVNMTSAMLDEELDELTDDVYETVAEMANIIAGGIKTFLSLNEEVFTMGLPQVLELASFDAQNDKFRVAIPIETDKGSFVIVSSLYESKPNV